MFEAKLKSDLKTIFDVDKVSLDTPSDMREQQCIFVQVDSARINVGTGRASGRVTGTGRMFANIDKLPYGYFMKRIAESDVSLTKNFYFYDIEENSGYYRNLAERTFAFIYFFDQQYNPNNTLLNEIETEVTT